MARSEDAKHLESSRIVARTLQYKHRLLAMAAVAGAAPLAHADGGVTFANIVDDPSSGLEYARVPSANIGAFWQLREQSLIAPIPLTAVFERPIQPHGMPGASLIDYDNDGDLDLYVTNGPGAANSLFTNLLKETGTPRFRDDAYIAGVEATDQDSTGSCFGDTDNDGDQDLYVLGRNEPNRFFENAGNGMFEEKLDSGLGGGNRSSTTCSMGDVNNDGFIDIAVANSFDQDRGFAIWNTPFTFNQHNQLFLNEGDNIFSDQSAASGIEDNYPILGAPDGYAGITWATAIVDVDLDGDSDIVFTDDQGAVPARKYGGIDRGYVHVFLNDGTGVFEDAPVLGARSPTLWMGVSFGDLDCDGHLDMFLTSLGDFARAIMGLPYDLGDDASRWMLGDGSGGFIDPGVGAVTATPFGWGNAITDYDNDGDQDIIFHGGVELSLAGTADNPGAVLQNQECSASFVRDAAAIKIDHLHRNVRGVAVGDIDNNGFTDVVTVANFTRPADYPLLPVPCPDPSAEPGSCYGSGFEPAVFGPHYAPVAIDETGAALFEWLGVQYGLGDLAVELNSGNNGNRAVQVRTLGSAGILANGTVNRDGLGAVVFATPLHGQTVMSPVVSGGTHLSQHELRLGFGLGTAVSARLEVLWPGGVRNRVYDVPAGSDIVVPEIPCSYTAEWRGLAEYEACVDGALTGLGAAGVISASERERLRSSARRAFFEVRAANIEQ